MYAPPLLKFFYARVTTVVRRMARAVKIQQRVTEMEKTSGNTGLLRGRVKASLGQKSPSKRQYGHESFH
jgi:hypothetical protein